jgi:glutaredoxin
VRFSRLMAGIGRSGGSVLLLLVVAAASLQAQPTAAAPPRVPVYFFWGDGCPHCATQKAFLAKLTAAHPAVEVHSLEVWSQVENRALFQLMAARAGFEASAVPVTFIGDRVWVGFHASLAQGMESAVVACLRSPCVDPGDGILGTVAAGPAESTTWRELPGAEERTSGSARDRTDTSRIGLPVLGTISLGDRSLAVSTALIAFVDGFNPCSLWVLSILLALVLHTGSRGKIALVGSTFLLVTAAVYGLFIAGLFTIFSVIDFLAPVQAIVALLALTFALINIKDYFWYRRGWSFTISDQHKPKIYRDIRGLLTPGKSTAALLGATIVMALGIALLELPCTAGFPVIWSKLLASHPVTPLEFSLLLGLYLAIYLLDELVVFGTAVWTLRMSRLQEKHGRVLKLVGGMVMLALALVLLLDPSRMTTVGGSLSVFAAAFGATLAVLVLDRRALPGLARLIGEMRGRGNRV